MFRWRHQLHVGALNALEIRDKAACRASRRSKPRFRRVRHENFADCSRLTMCASAANQPDVVLENRSAKYRYTGWMDSTIEVRDWDRSRLTTPHTHGALVVHNLDLASWRMSVSMPVISESARAGGQYGVLGERRRARVLPAPECASCRRSESNKLNGTHGAPALQSEPRPVVGERGVRREHVIVIIEQAESWPVGNDQCRSACRPRRAGAIERLINVGPRRLSRKL